MPSDGKGKGGVSGHSLSFPLLSPGPFFVQGKGWDSPTMLILRDFGPLFLLVTFSKFTIHVQARICRMFPFSCAGKAACACPPFFATIWTGGGGGGPFPSLPLRPSLSRSSWQEGALLLTPLLTPGKGERARVYGVREKRDGRGALSEEKKCLFASCEFGEIDVGGRGLECSVLL